MIEPYEQYVVAKYILKLVANACLPPKALGEICEFLERNGSLLGLDLWDEEFLALLDSFQETVREKTGTRTAYRKTLSAIKARLKGRVDELEQTPPGDLETNLSVLAEELNLCPLERDIFGLLIRYFLHDNFQRIFNEITRDHLNLHETWASCLNVDRHELTECLRPGSPLMASGIMCQPGRNGNDLDDHFEIPDAVRTGLQKACGAREDIRGYILGQPAAASLQWTDFDHLGEERNRLAKYLKTVLDNQIGGVNILLWGPPGTGKTEFCKTLAQHLEVKLYTIGEADEDGREPNRKERVASLQLAQNLLRFQNRSLLLFDEMDDLFEGNALARLFGAKLTPGSKVFINRLLENNPIPTIWIINEPRILDDAVIRRMSLAIEMPIPPVRAREKVWQRVLAKNALDLPPADTYDLAQLDISPAVIDSAARVALQIDGDIDDFRFAVRGIVKAISGKSPNRKPSDPTPFCRELIRTDLDLDKLIEQLQNSRQRDFSLCLYGPPGTGKSAFVRHLAESLNLPVLFKRASDLLDAYVGETEKSIAAAFQEAMDKEAFLVFDEADSFLGDRRHAVRSWEVSQVNEMLTWMESHPLPFACTTNLMDRLDQASLRRFTFKCHFDYLSEEQIDIAFLEFFGLQVPAKSFRNLKCLTPGDFALVRKKAQILGCETDVDGIGGLLEKELKEKGCRPERNMGFGRD